MVIYNEDIIQATNIATLGSIGLLTFSILASLDKIKDGTGFFETKIITILPLGGLLLIISSFLLLIYYHRHHTKDIIGTNHYSESYLYEWHYVTFLLGIMALLISFIIISIDFILPL